MLLLLLYWAEIMLQLCISVITKCLYLHGDITMVTSALLIIDRCQMKIGRFTRQQKENCLGNVRFPVVTTYIIITLSDIYLVAYIHE